MATAPLFNNPQGGTSTELSYVTTIQDQTLTGELATNTVDVQISINGDPFVADPTLVEFDLDEFTIPNRNVYPEGLRLEFGVNTIEVRAIDVVGAISVVSTAKIEVLRPDQVSLVSSAPTGLRVRRGRTTAEIVWAENTIPNVRGYNVYASSETGGGTSGYVRLNRDLITDVSFQETVANEVTADATNFANEYGALNILLTQEDFSGNALSTAKDSSVDISLAGATVRATTTIETIVTTSYFSFFHDRDATETDGTINNEIFSDIPDDEPLFYVITSVVYDPITNQEIESAYSSELIGLPLTIDTQIRELPRRTRFEVSEDYITSILRFDNEISVIPGSVPRDVFIDPFATEAERLYFITDFVRRAGSFSTLLIIDDLPSYKEALAAALGLNVTTEVQPIIDDSFDKLAANVGVNRQGAEDAVGEVTFYTTSEPTSDLVIEEGTLVSVDSGPSFRVTSRVTLPFTDRQSYFNLQRSRWEITANIRATESGESGNVAAGRIRRVIGGASGLQVNNFEATQFGRDEESNEDLAERSILAFSSVDAGTAAGYLATALRQVGVFRAEVIEAGDFYMVRDYDEVRNKNIGGKVDVWVQGERRVSVSDTFALAFDVERDMRFFLDSSPSDLIFISDDDRLTPSSPITQVLGQTPSEVAQGFGFRNVTTGEDFDVTGVSIIDYNRIQLNTTIPQPVANPNDLVVGDIRFRESNQYVFTRQPVIQVDSVSSVNTSSVLEEGTNYDLYQTEDPLEFGHSTLAEDYLQITRANGVPSGDLFVVNDERHVLVGEIPESLDNLGASSVTVRIFTLDRLTEYEGPLSTGTPDFFIQEGDETNPLQIVRNPAGNIGNGEEVSIDYEHDENFQVTYVINDLITDVQGAFETQRHVTADVLAKESVSNQIDLEMTVVLSVGANQSTVDAAVRTAISQLMNSKGIGEEVHQSDIVRVVENTDGVNYVVLPVARFTHADGNLIVRESLNNAFTFLDAGVSSNLYILREGLNYATTDGGGDGTRHLGVFQDRLPISVVSSYSQLQTAVNSALIIGNDGLVISGYSDDATLTSEGFNTDAERDTRRKELTANHVLLALDKSDSPENHGYEVSYQVTGDSASSSTIQIAGVAFAELGDLTITYQES